MLSVVKSYIEAKLNLNERGAEMVEYAIVLACIAAVGVYFYSSAEGKAGNGLKAILESLWGKVSTEVSKIS